MDYIIARSKEREMLEKPYWILLYGRRKVGKTFLLRNLCKFENYYTVKKDLGIISNKGTMPMERFVQEVKSLLEQNKTVVIDEFQRLDEGLLEEISLLHPKGKLILSGSSLRVVKKVFDPKSPLLGFFTPFKIGFIKPSNVLLELNGDGEEAIQAAPFLREPWTISLYNKEDILRFIYELVTKSKYTITALIGEIFTEEERELTKRYESILALIGSGIWNTKEITSILYSRKLIPDPSPTHLIQYLKNLEEMELVESIKLHGPRGRYYRLASPIMNIFYYLDSRYDINNRDISFEEVKPTLEKLVNIEIQNFIGDLFAELYNGRKEYFVSADKEIDFIITKRNKVEIVGEVKWKKITVRDVERFKGVSEMFHGKKVLICKGSELKSEDVEILTPRELFLILNRFQNKSGADKQNAQSSGMVD